MGVGINSLLDMGKWALFGTQAAIQTTGNNIANVHTEGYSRRSVRFEENFSIDTRPGQIGTGVRAAEVLRHFDEFIETQYLEKHADESRYEALSSNLSSINSLISEANTDGLHDSIDQFFRDWQDMTQRPEDYSSRETLLADTEKLVSLFRNMDEDFQLLQDQAGDVIRQQVEDVNDILYKIADVNKRINAHDNPGVNNANALYDERDQLLRDLSGYMDINIANRGGEFNDPTRVEFGTGADYAITTKAGHLLVQGVEFNEITYEGPQSDAKLIPSSNFDGEIQFSGSDDFEYTVEVIRGGQVSNASGPGTAQFRVSLDGGFTWLKDTNGEEQVFFAGPQQSRIGAGDLEIWFEGATQNLEVGDTFSIMPRDGIYWYQNTSSKLNITPQIRGDGSDDPKRLVGGSLTALSNFSGPVVGTYRDQMDAMVKSMVWAVNRQHSQGAGLSFQSQAQGSYQVNDPTIALGDDASGLPMSTFLEDGAGNMSLYFFDEDTGDAVLDGGGQPVGGPLTFPGGNFDPATDSLQDVVDAINTTYSPAYMTADIVNNRIRLTAADGVEFAFGSDSTGVWAALGVNTYFTGSKMNDIAIKDDIVANTDRINASHVNGAYEVNRGDNTTALAIAAIADTDLTIVSAFGVSNKQTIGEYYATTMARVGADAATAEFNYTYNKTLADDLAERQNQVAGVNLDEEMSNLIKFQNSYRAAAKLITTADQMLQTVLGLKQ